MEQLIPLVNRLQDCVGAAGQATLELPQIVVVGSQSSGKSSVLESIVGRDFLPRGFGIVTRRPLVLQLYHIERESLSNEELARGEEWGEFLHLEGQRFYDFNAIREEIVRDTERVTGRNKGISKETINLKIFSPHVLNLTLVDLPGITKVPTGDQPLDIEKQIREMCLEYISNPNAILLAVSAANVDLANSDGLQIAREVDRDGSRTIGVLTKVDLMDHGTDCCDVLENSIIPLRRGYVAIVNRSQKDIQENVSIRTGLVKESQYFASHPKYRHFLTHCGTKNLSRKLNQILMTHIRQCLPELRKKMNDMLSEARTNLLALGESIDDKSPSVKGATLLRILNSFCQKVTQRIDGTGGSHAEHLKELHGGARIAYIFNESFGKKMAKMDALHGLTDEDIRTAIANANGLRPSLYVPEAAFDLLVRRQIATMESFGLQCLDLVMTEMHSLVDSADSLEMERFPQLRDRILQVANSLVQSHQPMSSKMISNLIQIELAYINTNHPDFVITPALQQRVDAPEPSARGVVDLTAPPTVTTRDNVNNFAGNFQRKVASTVSNVLDTVSSRRFLDMPETVRCDSVPTERERTDMEIIKSLIKAYFNIAKKNFVDMVPKTIMRFLVLEVKENLQTELVSQLYQEEVLSTMMREGDEIAAKRRELQESNMLLACGLNILNDVRDFQI